MHYQMYCLKKKQALEFENKNLQLILGNKSRIIFTLSLNKAHVIFRLGFMLFPCGGPKFNCL